jgi:bile acid:Na+ symporter, BASS family
MIASVIVPAALAVVMLSLGLSLTVADFRRVIVFPRPVVVALICQMIALPLICFVVIKLFGLCGELAVGMMLLAAAPAGVTANVLSHIFDGEVALNVTLTAINSFLSLFSLPLIVGFALHYFMRDSTDIDIGFGKVLQVFMIVLGPVALGMLLRGLMPRFAERVQRPVKILAGLFLILVAILAISADWDNFVHYFPVLGAAVLSLNIACLAMGYYIPLAARLDRRQAIAIGMEIGIQNGTLAIAIAMSPLMLDSATMAAPASMYGIMMIFTAAAFGWLVTRRQRSQVPDRQAAARYR